MKNWDVVASVAFRQGQIEMGSGLPLTLSLKLDQKPLIPTLLSAASSAFATSKRRPTHLVQKPGETFHRWLGGFTNRCWPYGGGWASSMDNDIGSNIFPGHLDEEHFKQ
jgi:hypothetical protein